MSAVKGYPKVTGTWAKHQGEWVIAIKDLDSTEEVLEVTVVTKAGVASKKFIRPAFPVGHKAGAALYAACSGAAQGKAPVEKIAAPRGYDQVVRNDRGSEARPAHNRGTAWEREFDCDYAI